MRSLPKSVWVLFLLVILVVIANAWMSDDSYITLRTVYHFTEGYGLRWNISERVQVFTHPLWMMLQVPVYAVVQHAYFTAIPLNILLTAVSLVFLIRYAKGPNQIYFALLLLLSSKAFIDYATSGLENALSYLLFLLLVHKSGKAAKEDPDELLQIVFLSSLLLLTRLDFLLLLAPAVGWRLYSAGVLRWSTIKVLLLGGLPLVAWEVFALIYYGSFFPNTYYAKAETGLPSADLIQQGYRYFQDSLQQDWFTLPIIILAIFWGSFQASGIRRAWALGLIFYLSYICGVGGDFMSGRFFSVPFLVAILLLQHIEIKHSYTIYACGLVLAISLFQPYHPVHIRPSYFQDRKEHVKELYPHGIVDEKGFAWERSGFLDLRPWDHVFNIERLLAEVVAQQKNDTINSWEIRVAIGMQGYEAGPGTHIVDQLALSDPLLARLPAERRPNLRVGHYFRKIPLGYVETLRSGRDQFADRDLAAYYRHIHRITTAPLWTKERWRSIYLLQSGQLDHLIDRSYYQTPPALD
ncbi:MAG: hypothetical protein AAFO02_17620 [Bacteroidota bacterium]